MDELIRSAINLLIEASSDPEKKRRVSRAIAAVGKLKSEKSDISVEHDKYLEEDFTCLGLKHSALNLNRKYTSGAFYCHVYLCHSGSDDRRIPESPC